MVDHFGDVKLDEITPADVERYLHELLTQSRTQATVNRYRGILSAMLSRARRFGLVTANPVTGATKYREPEGWTLYLLAEDKAQEKAAIREALRPDLRPLFTVSIHMGFRWSEQIALEWRDVDFFSGSIGVQRSKCGYSRVDPMNSVVRSVLMDLASQRKRLDDPSERVFHCSYVQPDKFFPAAVERARTALVNAGQDVTRLEGYTWHCNRHTFASRLVMASVDLYTVQRLGGWRTFKMVQRYAHLAPEHLREAVERLVTISPASGPSSGPLGAVEVPRKCPAAIPGLANVS
jgi:site-specific recombinase XerD